MEKLGGVVQSKGGRVVIGATIQVFIAGTNTPATVYADRAGISQLAIVKTDNEGEWGCYAPNGRYDVFTTVNGRRDGQYTDYLLYDPDDDTDNGSDDGPTNADIAMLSSRIDVANLVLSSLDGRVTANNTSLNSRVTDVEDFSESLFGTNATNNIYGFWADNNPAPVSALADEVGAAMIGADGGGSVQSEINALKTSNGANVLSTILSGLSTANNAVIAATDTVLSAFGKLQAQVSGKQNSSAKDASGGYAGLTGFAINIKNAAGTAISKLVSTGASTRTYTFPDKDGTVAMMSDVTASGSLVLLGQGTIGSTVSNIDFLNIFSQDYSTYIIFLDNFSITSQGSMNFNFAINGSVDSSISYVAAGGSSGFSSAALMAGQAAGGRNISISLEIGGVNIGAESIRSRAIYFSSSNTLSSNTSESLFTASGNVTGFRIYGSFATGVIRIYGIRNS